MAVFARLRPLVPPSALAVAESGVGGPADFAAYARDGADAVLAGEACVRGDDPAETVRTLIGCRSGSRPQRAGRPMTPVAQVPDETGHYGPYGGRFVPEALIAALDQLTAEYAAARVDPEFTAALDGLLDSYAGRPTPITDAKRLTEVAGGARIMLKREGPRPHRLAQDQQRARSGAADPAHGQAAGDRRDRRRPARRRDGHRLRAARPRMRRLHGRGRHRPSGAERGADAAARRRGHPGQGRQAAP